MATRAPRFRITRKDESLLDGSAHSLLSTCANMLQALEGKLKPETFTAVVGAALGAQLSAAGVSAERAELLAQSLLEHLREMGFEVDPPKPRPRLPARAVELGKRLYEEERLMLPQRAELAEKACFIAMVRIVEGSQSRLEPARGAALACAGLLGAFAPQRSR